MNKAYLGISIILVLAAMAVGQKSTTKRAPLADSDRAASGMTLASGTSIEAQLQKTVDVNNARVGDDVVLKVTKSIKQSGEVVVPKGSTLVGRVTEVQKRTKQNGMSKLGIVFDRIQGNGTSAPFSASIVSITNAAARSTVGDSMMTDTSATSQSSGSVSRGGSSGGGLLGGVGNTVGGLVNTTTQTAGSVTNSVTQTASGATGTVGRTISGLQISGGASGSANSSTTLSSGDKNVRIEKGASFNLRTEGQLARQE